MNSFRCSNCSLLNFDTAGACKRCGLPFDAPAEPAGGAQDFAPSQQYPPPAEGNSYFWDQPNYQPSYIPPRPAPPPSRVGQKVAGVLVFLASMSLVAFVAIPRLIKSKKADLTNLTWSEYKAPDGSFTVSLPAEPKEMQLNQQTPDGPAKLRAVMAQVGRDGACMVMYVDYPPLRKVTEEMLYEQTIKNMESGGGTTRAAITGQKFIEHDGRRGIELDFKPKAPEGVEGKGRARLFIVTPRVYVVMSGGPESPEYEAVTERCLNSFKFSDGR